MIRIAALLLAGGLGMVQSMHAQSPPAQSASTQASSPQASSMGGGFELVDGDRVVLLGSGFVEAAQEYGYVELALSTRWPDRDVTFRNVGWSGDTVFGEARLHYTNPPGPYRRLLDEATAHRPSVLFVGYGSNVPFEEGSALERFEDGLVRLLTDLEAETGARIILLSPPPHEVDMSPAPAEFVGRINGTLKEVSDVVERVARERGHLFVDVFGGLDEVERGLEAPITHDGVQMNAAGYYHLAGIVEEGLGLEPRGSDAESPTERNLAERLRRLIVEKNRLYFHRYRPPNGTYLVGFRSYEQGQNAEELGRFGPLIEEKEREIGQLKRSAPLTLVPAAGP